MRKIKIAPSILSADFSKMGEEVKNLGPAPKTGDSWRVVLWSAAAAALVILIIVRRRRRTDYEK